VIYSAGYTRCACSTTSKIARRFVVTLMQHTCHLYGGTTTSGNYRFTNLVTKSNYLYYSAFWTRFGYPNVRHYT